MAGATVRPKRSPPAPAGSIWAHATWSPLGVVSTDVPVATVGGDDVTVRGQRHAERGVQGTSGGQRASGTATPPG